MGRSSLAWIGVNVFVLGLWSWANGSATESKAGSDDSNFEDREAALARTGLNPNAIPRGPDDVLARIEADSQPKEATLMT